MIDNKNETKKSLFWMGALLALESLAAAIYLIVLPRDPKNSIVLGYSLQRLVMILGMLGFSGLFGFFALKTSKATSSFVPKLSKILERNRVYVPVCIGLVIVFIASFVGSQYPRGLIDPAFLAYFDRLLPVIIWLWVISLELLLGLIISRTGFTLSKMTDLKHTIRAAAWITAAFMAVWIFIRVTGLGTTIDKISWRQMGSPLLAWQIWASLLVGALMVFLEVKFFRGERSKTQLILDIILVVAVYCTALAIWLPLPIQMAYSAPRVRPPNFTVYPYSDAMFYSASAESVINGSGLYAWSVVPRPFFITELAYVFALAKGVYQQVINIQTFHLAGIPVVIYLLGRKLMGRSFGFAAALLVIFREASAILSTHYIPVSHSKLILSDLPTMLVMVIFLYFLVKWLLDGYRKPVWALLVGGCLGWMMLFRTQVVALLPFVLLLGWLRAPREIKTWLKQAILITAALVVIIAPWLIRNYVITGQVTFDDPTQTSLVVNRYIVDPSQETDNGSEKQPSLISAVINEPAFVAGFISNHFLRNVICTVFVTPPQAMFGSVSNLMEDYPFWRDDQVFLTDGQILQLIAMLSFMALGIGTLYRKTGIAGLAPLVIFVGYDASNALARNSGGRYNLPMDWVGYFYLAAGVIQAVIWLYQALGMKIHLQEQALESARGQYVIHWKQVALTLVILGLVGGFIPFTEKIFPVRYNVSAKDGLKTVLDSWGIADERVDALMNDPAISYAYGLELFPRFYPPNVGEPGSSWVAYSPKPSCRMGLLVMDPTGMKQVVVQLDAPPTEFPSRKDAIVLGPQASGLVRGRPVDYIDARIIILNGEPPIILEGLDRPGQGCAAQ